MSRSNPWEKKAGTKKGAPTRETPFLKLVHDEPLQYEKAGHFLVITTWFLPSQEM